MNNEVVLKRLDYIRQHAESITNLHNMKEGTVIDGLSYKEMMELVNELYTMIPLIL